MESRTNALADDAKKSIGEEEKKRLIICLDFMLNYLQIQQEFDLK
jgi:hypothetical protein